MSREERIDIMVRAGVMTTQDAEVAKKKIAEERAAASAGVAPNPGPGVENPAPGQPG